MKKQKGIAAFFVVTLLLVTPALSAQITWYVDDDAPNDPGPADPTVSDPLENGSQEHPFDDPQEAIDAATSDDLIRVAVGTYWPDASGLQDPREATFQLEDGVRIEGGYAGDWSTRDIGLYASVLSGDLLGNDPCVDDNSYHVVSAGSSIASIGSLTVSPRCFATRSRRRR